MSKSYTWKETDGGWDAFDGAEVVARVYRDYHTKLGEIYIAYAYNHSDDKSGHMHLEHAKNAALNFHEDRVDDVPEVTTTKPPSSGELNWLAQQRYGRMYGALTPEERETLTSTGYDRLLTEEEEAIMKPPAINRQDPAWAMFAAASVPRFGEFSREHIVALSCNLADAMIRERDRRDREERP